MGAGCIPCRAVSHLLNFRGSLTGRRGGKDGKAVPLIRCCLTDTVWKQMLPAADVMRYINTKTCSNKCWHPP